MYQERTITGQPIKNKAKVEATLVKRGHHGRMHRAQSQNRSQKNDQPVHVIRDHQVRGDRILPVQEKTTDQGLRRGLHNIMITITD